MKRMFGLGLGVAWAASVGAADPRPVSVYPPSAVQPAALPAGLKYADPANVPSGIAAVAANEPVAPTVPAPYTAAEALPAAIPAPVPAPAPVAEPAPPVADAGCAGCEKPVVGHRHGGKFVNWLCFKPGPAVLPRFVPNTYQTPLMNYFPTHPLPPCPPGVTNIPVGGTSIIPRFASPNGIAPVIAAPVEQAPSPAAKPSTKPTEPTVPPADAPDKKTDPEKPTDPDPKRTTRAGWGVFPVSGPKVVPVGATEAKPGPVGRLLDFIDPVKPAGTTPPTISFKEMISGPKLQDRSDAGSPQVKPIVARGQILDMGMLPPTVDANGGSIPTEGGPGCATCGSPDVMALMGLTTVFAKCEKHALKAPCTGHGDLSGYRFAEPIVKPCPPLLPLRVKDCGFGGGLGDGAGCASGACAVPTAAGYPVAKAPAADRAKKADEIAATKPFTNP